MRPLVTVIILSYRNTSGIYPTLKSVLDQTYDNVEIIFSDDGTPEFKEEIHKIDNYLLCYQKGNISNVVYNALPQNVGTVKNFNSALRLCNGRYIKGLSSHDKLSHPNVLSAYVDFMVTHDSQVLFAKMRGVTPDGQYKYKLQSCESNYEKLRGYTIEQTRNRLFRRNFLPAPAWMIDRDVFSTYGLFPESTRLIEDYPYWLHLTSKGVSFDYMDEIAIDYQLSGISSSGSYSEAFMKDMLVIYNNYIFPYDRRFGLLQSVYNMLKRQGLNFYIAEAQRSKMTGAQKLCARIKYLPFWALVSVQGILNEAGNKYMRCRKKERD